MSFDCADFVEAVTQDLELTGLAAQEEIDAACEEEDGGAQLAELVGYVLENASAVAKILQQIAFSDMSAQAAKAKAMYAWDKYCNPYRAKENA